MEPFELDDDIDVTPDLNYLKVLRFIEYRSWYAFAEFIDNSLESFRKHRDRLDNQQLEVIIEIDNDLITITDNAAGIFEHELGRAFRMAVPPDDATGLSEFGVGMKSASLWFTTKFVVTTSAIGETTTKIIEYDLNKITEQRTTKIKALRLPKPPEKHGTKIELFHVDSVPQGATVAKIKAHLPDIYRRFLKNGDLVIKFKSAGEKEAQILKWEDVEIRKSKPTPKTMEVSGNTLDPEKEYVWKKDIHLNLGLGQKATGWAALREKGTSKGYNGFALIRRGRLIQGSDNEAWNPFGGGTSADAQRVFGELEIEGIGVSHTKSGFKWDEQEFGSSFAQLLIDEIDKADMPLRTQANTERWRRRDNDTNATKTIDEIAGKATKDTALEIEELLEQHILDDNNAIQESPLPSSNINFPSTPPSTSRESTFTCELNNESWKITVQITNEESADAENNWFKVTHSDRNAVPKTVVCTMYLSNPFSERWLTDPERQQPFMRIVGALAISEIKFLNHESPSSFRRDFNKLLSQSRNWTTR